MGIITTAIYCLIEVIQWAIFIRVFLSWFPIPRDNAFSRILFQITEPVLAPIRAIIEKSAIGHNTMIDFSPIVAFLILSLISSMLF